MEQIFSKFVCETCHREKKTNTKRDNRFSSSKLMRTQLGDFLESRVNNYLKNSAPSELTKQAGKVTIRILSSVDKICEVKQNMKNRFDGEVTETFPFKTKAIFAFEEIDGTDVVFFGMHVQEYGSECQPPNTRRVYISYLDSVFFFRPKELRTNVYHEILIGYLDYAKRLGYQWAHIWACPPSEGDDYIFHCHPVEQKVPKPKRLQDWYKKMLDKGIIERVVIDYKDIHKDAIENGMKTPLDIPYFEGDFWPNVLEECIKESEQEEEKRRKEEAEAAMAAANEDFSTCGDDSYGDGMDNSKDGITNSNGKKKNMNNQQKKKNIKNKMSQRKSVKKVGSSSTDLMTKILSTMEKHKEVFFVIRLLEPKQVAQMGSIVDRDPPISCELMNGRDEFLNFARDKHHEFSSLRRAKYSSMALLYELHNQGNEKFVYTCNKCKCQMEIRYHCTVCEDFDLCIGCYEVKGGHEHKMDKLAAGTNSLAEDQTPGAKQNQSDSKQSDDSKLNQSNQQKAPKPYIEMYLNTFMHAVNCRNANCTFAKCMQFKRVVQHSKQCQKFKNSQCEFCRQLITLCIYHAKSCKDEKCQVPLCNSIKLKLKQQKALNTQAERRRMLMMNKTLRQSANTNSIATPASPADEETNPSASVQNQQQMQQNSTANSTQQMSNNNNMINSSKNLQYQQQNSALGQQLNHNSNIMNQNTFNNMNGLGHNQQQQHHHQQPTITINLPSSNPNTLIHTTPQYVNSNQAQQQQQMQMNPTNVQSQYHNQSASYHPQHHQQQYNQQQQHLIQQQQHQQQHLNHNTNLISNPSSSSPSPSVMNSAGLVNNSLQHAQLNYNQGYVSNAHVSQINQQQNPSNIQQQSTGLVMNSPGKAQFAQNTLNIQQQPGLNRQNMLQQQQPSISPSPTSGLYNQVGNNPNINANVRIMSTNTNNLSNVSPHPTPSSTPTPNQPGMTYPGSNSDLNNVDNTSNPQINNWQQPQVAASTNNPQYPNMMNIRGNAVNQGSIGSPAPNLGTASPVPNVQQQPTQQTNVTYTQQFRQNPTQPPVSNEYLTSLIQQFKSATTNHERSQRLNEIKNLAPNVYQRIVSSLQQHNLQQQQQMNSTNTINANPVIQGNTNVHQQVATNNQQWSQFNQGYNGQNQPNNAAVSSVAYINAGGQQQAQQQQQQRYNTNMQPQQMAQQPRQILMPGGQPQSIVLQQGQQQQQQQQIQLNNPQIIQQQPQQRLVSQQMAPQQMLQQQQRLQMQPQINQMGIRQQNQQGAYIQQQQPQQIQMMNQQSNHFQDQQIINQTKDQMLLQAPNKLNSNQQINPSDTLSQIADNL